MIKKGLCVRCKGKLLCDLGYCPILASYSAKTKLKKYFDKEMEGASPTSVFVSWQDYPKVTVGALATANEGDVAFYDIPEQWYGISAERIVEMRSSLLMAAQRFNVNSASSPNQTLQKIQELTMSSSDVEVSVELEKLPEPKLSFCGYFGPMGPKAPMKKIELAANPKIDRKVEYITNDTDAATKDALIELYESGYRVSFLQKLLSMGLLGQGNRRKIVPTRWAITAVDSTVSEQLIEEGVKQHPLIDFYELYHSCYLENDFWVLMIPNTWAFEQLECWLPGNVWTQEERTPQIIHDHEFYNGRKNYAENVEGAYYAARLAVAEHLTKRKRQAACIVFREISEKYAVPLGVWQIRENVRFALKQRPLCFESLDKALELLAKKLRVSINSYIMSSEIIKYLKKQKKITEWF
ncbi:MAG: Nre family DNA repair protein [Candidatus Diapherotrites archaeon]